MIPKVAQLALKRTETDPKKMRWFLNSLAESLSFGQGRIFLPLCFLALHISLDEVQDIVLIEGSHLN